MLEVENMCHRWVRGSLLIKENLKATLRWIEKSNNFLYKVFLLK